MEPIVYIDRVTGRKETEKVFGAAALQLLYGGSFFGRILSHLASKQPWFSALYGYCQKTAYSQSKIQPFIKVYDVDPAEFLDPVSSYGSFNDFFIRKLKPAARPIDDDKFSAIIPADGRYWFYADIDHSTTLSIKGSQINIARLLGDAQLARRYHGGACVVARLCPSDYHRFHFPVSCTPGEARLINGPLYSVNPIALRKNLAILWENKRKVTLLQSELFGEIAYVEIGATNVGTIVETYQPGRHVLKGAEKGYFSFGGSALVLLFEPGKLELSDDLVQATVAGFEMRCLLGQRLGRSRSCQD